MLRFGRLTLWCFSHRRVCFFCLLVRDHIQRFFGINSTIKKRPHGKFMRAVTRLALRLL